MVSKIVLVIPNYNWDKDGNDYQEKNILWHFIPYNLCLLAAVLEQEPIMMKLRMKGMGLVAWPF